MPFILTPFPFFEQSFLPNPVVIRLHKFRDQRPDIPLYFFVGKVKFTR